MLELKNVSVHIEHMPIVNDVSMEVHKGEIISLIGANGAGKTTLVRAISGLYKVVSGSIRLDGEEITSFSADELVENGIVQVPEGRKLFSRMTVYENLEIGAYTKRARDSFKEKLEFVFSLFPELEEMRKKAAGDLSGGQQQMVAIGRGIMANPKLLILDEPSIGLSPIMTQNVLKAVERIHENGVAVLITEQNIQAVLKIASRAYVMEQGNIVLSGSASEMLGNDEVKKIYLGM